MKHTRPSCAVRNFLVGVGAIIFGTKAFLFINNSGRAWPREQAKGGGAAASRKIRNSGNSLR